MSASPKTRWLVDRDQLPRHPDRARRLLTRRRSSRLHHHRYVPAGFALPPGLSGPMPAAIASHVAAVVLFGTPDSWFLNLVDRGAPPITIGQLYAGKTLQLCGTGDPVCFPGGLDRSAHSSYKDNGMADQAADFAAHHLSVSAPAAAVQQTAGQASAGEPPVAPTSELDPTLGN